MRGSRKTGKRKVTALLLVLTAALAVLFFLLPRQDPGENLQTTLVPAGAAAERKSIYDRHFRALAVSLQLTSAYARPLELQDPETMAEQLASLLGKNEKELLAVLKSERGFVWLGRRLDSATGEKIAALQARGLYLIEEEERFYPHGRTAAHVLGFSSDEQGLAGIEFTYDHLLQGGLGREAERGAALSLADQVGDQGAHLVLTLDVQLQSFLEGELEELKKKTGAQGATGLVLVPASGEILALASLPSFDPNLFWKFDSAARRNRALSDAVRPGALRNFLEAAAAADAGLMGMDEEAVGREAAGAAPQRKDLPGGASRLHADWAEVEAGVFGSPALARARVKLPGQRLEDWLGLPGGIDLPAESATGFAERTGEEGGQLRALHAVALLSLLSRLTIEERAVRPHLLKAVKPPEGELQTVSFPEGAGPVSAPARQAALRLLQKSAGPGNGAAWLLESATLEPQPGAAAGKPEQKAGDLYQDVLFGALNREPRLTFLVVLEGARLDLSRPSLLRQLGGRLARRSGTGLAMPAASSFPAGKPEEKFYQQWRQVHGFASQTAEPTAREEDRMPDLRGLGLRKALQTLQPYGIRVLVNGSGRVVTHRPPAGESLDGVREIRLELRPDA